MQVLNGSSFPAARSTASNSEQRQPSMQPQTATDGNLEQSSCRAHCADLALTALILVALATRASSQIPNSIGKIAAGDGHTLALLANGTVKSWGRNIYGQLGLGTTTNQLTPQVIPGLTGVTALAAGQMHSIALLSNGTVKTWGWNGNGELGLGHTTNQYAPQPIPALYGVTAIAGNNHGLALLFNGTVKAWGMGDSGQLGLGNSASHTTPQLIPNLSGVTAIAVGVSHSLALLSNGTVKAWGDNSYGQLGLGNLLSQSTPQLIPSLTGVIALRAGSVQSLALMSNGSVKAWGYNFYGQLGIGNLINQTTPQTIPGIVGAAALAASNSASFVALASGAAVAFGNNGNGQLGIGTTTNQTMPQPISGLTTTMSLAGGAGHTIALLSNGAVKTWGQGNWGQLGLGTTSQHTTPQLVSGLNLVALQASVSPTSPIVDGCVWAVDGYFAGAPGTLYVFDVSLNGTTPGIPIPGVGTVPLNPPLLNLDYGPSLSPWLVNFVGLLDANAHAAPTVLVPYLPALIGTTLTGAAITLDPSTATQIGYLTTAAATQIVASAPLVTSVSPPTGPIAGGTSLTVLGGGFLPGATLTIGGVAAGSLVVASSSQITCMTPAGVLGGASIIVTNPGAQPAVLLGGYTYLPNLALGSVTPMVAPVGATISVNGAGFDITTLVFAGGQAANATLVSSTQLTFVMPSGLACSTSVVVGNATLQSATLSGFNPSPAITSIPLSSGPAAGGSQVAVLGSNFYPGTSLTIGGQPVAITSLTQTTVLGVAPAGTPGAAPLVVSSVNGCTATGTWTWN